MNLRLIHNKQLKTMKKFPSKLQSRTLELFLKAPRHVRNSEISKATGLSSSWLSDFSKNPTRELPAGKLEKLYNYLSPTPFEI